MRPFELTMMKVVRSRTKIFDWIFFNYIHRNILFDIQITDFAQLKPWQKKSKFPCRPEKQIFQLFFRKHEKKKIVENKHFMKNSLFFLDFPSRRKYITSFRVFSPFLLLLSICPFVRLQII